MAELLGSTKFSDIAASYGISDKARDALNAEEIFTIDEFHAMSADDMKILRTAGVNLGQKNKLDMIRRIVYPPPPVVVSNPSVCPPTADPGNVVPGNAPNAEPGTVQFTIHADPPPSIPGNQQAPGGSTTQSSTDDAILPGMGAHTANKATISQLRDHPELDTAGKLHDYLTKWDHLTKSGLEDPLLADKDSLYAPPGLGFARSDISSKPTPPVISPDDPRAILYMRATNNKAIHITSFLSEEAKKRLRNRKSLVLVNSEGGIQTSDPGIESYKGIGIFEYGAANMRLLNYLLEEGILPRDQVEYYLAYTTLVYELAETKPWDAVLSWDFRYRERQAQLNFPWGSRVTMMDLALIGGHKQGFPGPNQDPNPKPKPKKIICKNFSNNGWCNFGNECNYKNIL